jgi:hypothetical protein
MPINELFKFIVTYAGDKLQNLSAAYRQKVAKSLRGRWIILEVGNFFASAHLKVIEYLSFY